MTRDDKERKIKEYCQAVACSYCKIYAFCQENEESRMVRHWSDEGVNEAYKVIKDIEDIVNHPQHYERNGIECIDVMIETQGAEAVAAFCICNAFKYLYRWKHKNGVEDIKKAKWYIDKFLEIEAGRDENRATDEQALQQEAHTNGDGLKKCPHCGSGVIQITKEDDTGVIISCPRCEYAAGADTIEEAIKEWNNI